MDCILVVWVMDMDTKSYMDNDQLKVLEATERLNTQKFWQHCIDHNGLSRKGEVLFTIMWVPLSKADHRDSVGDPYVSVMI
jgi:hypothetical protein